MLSRVLVVRTDSDGDVLLSGPAIRAVARRAEVTVLVSPSGEQAARLLPGVDDVVVWPCPWAGFAPPPVDRHVTQLLVENLAARGLRAALIFTSFHQSPLPTALLLRLAGVEWIGANSVDFPGSLLDLRLQPGPDDQLRHEVRRSIDLATAAGFPPAPDDDLRLAVRGPLLLPPCYPVAPEGDHVRGPRPARPAPGGPVVFHPGASVPARAPTPEHAEAIAAALARAGHDVVVTGGRAERDLTAAVARAAGRQGFDLGGRTSLVQLGGVLEAARCAVVGNTGPAHLAAAIGTPVVSLFAPVVPASRWRPWGVPHVLLGDQSAPCRDSRARRCPLPGHPCLSSIDPRAVVDAVEVLTRLARPAEGADPARPEEVLA
jgi:ADP-heptose:LPS heptosyltransferase